MGENLKRIMVIGGGIAGIQASLDLAERGIKVELIEKNACIGGRMAQLDKTFPTNDCSICILAPKLAECFRHSNITLHTLSEIKNLSGQPGNFNVKIFKKARYVKADECINCGQCIEKCPMRVDDEFDMKLRKRRAIYIDYVQGVPSIMTIDRENCLFFTKNACRICEKVCEREAIDFDQKDEEIELNVGSIIVATGYDIFDPKSLESLGYGRYPNVVTSLEFERLICASGPLGGHLKRPSDKNDPTKLAFINCVGSRDIKNNPYCSSCCCMYTTKEAMIAYEHNNEIETSIFYIDLRAAGKGFREYIKRGEDDYSITYIKGKVARILEDDQGNPLIVYEDINTSKVKQLKFDLVILATTMVPKKDAGELAKILGIKIDDFNFFKANSFQPQISSKEGIFLCGACREPMDIPSSVVDASGAAAKAAEIVMRG
ncbi:MAG: CoB--CoM heterodisulfide reductase iron-sulfur subunit A family protein [Candidatus Lokiarchaeota archaeon]|nr:CoB--CoM heterodisulfide reductase iron-sulfur subunit A family protein [Candidatus Lokiarchaeota archaeon]